MGKRFRWLIPGMGVKRWIALIIFGALIFGLGLIIFPELNIVDLIVPYIENPWLTAILLIIIGVAFAVIGIKSIILSIVEVFSPDQVNDMAEKVYRKRSLERGPRIVVIGGGTGLSTLLRGLKTYSTNITAIVTVADDGGSSGKIRTELGILPPGDIRNNLVALADTEPLMEKLFQYRFSWGEGLTGHSFGNLFIAAMTDITGDFETAVQKLSKVLAVGGVVLPATLKAVKLKAEYSDGSYTIGESQIPQIGKKIDRISLLPHDVYPVPEALAAIEAADLIVIGPGSLYTSLIPNLLVLDICETLEASNAVKVYVGNVMTQPGETDGMSAGDHVRAIFKHTGQKKVFDYAVFNNQRLSTAQLRNYREQKAYPVELDLNYIHQLGVQPIALPLLDRSQLARHDSELLARTLIKLTLEFGSGIK